MLELFYSNRHETLSQALFDDLAAFAMNSGDPFASQPVIVPSAAVRRRLELDMADAFRHLRERGVRLSRAMALGADRPRD